MRSMDNCSPDRLFAANALQFARHLTAFIECDHAAGHRHANPISFHLVHTAPVQHAIHDVVDGKGILVDEVRSGSSYISNSDMRNYAQNCSAPRDTM